MSPTALEPRLGHRQAKDVGSLRSRTVKRVSNDFTTYDVGNIEGTIQFTGGSLLPLIGGGNRQPCPGLFTGGMTWLPSVLLPGYVYRHDGRIDLQCPTAASGSTWGRVKSLYR